MDCFGTYFTHAQTCDNVRVQSATQWTASVHTLHMPKPVIRFVFSGCACSFLGPCMQWTASVHTLHMPKPVITFVFKVLRNGLLRYILYTCPNLWERSCSKCYAMDCFGTYFTHAQTCDKLVFSGCACSFLGPCICTVWTCGMFDLIALGFMVPRTVLLSSLPPCFLCLRCWVLCCVFCPLADMVDARTCSLDWTWDC